MRHQAMASYRAALAVTCLALAVHVPKTVSSEVVYYATPGSYDNYGVEVGTQVVLAATERIVVRVGFNAQPSSVPSPAMVRIRFYANDGSQGAPGTVIWDSGLREYKSLIYEGSYAYAVEVPNVVVPDSFTVTLSPSSGSMLYGMGVPSVGTAAREWHRIIDAFWGEALSSRARSFRINALQGSAGSIRLDREHYRCDQTVGITVRDDDLAGSSSQPVVVTASGGDREVVLLTPRSAGSGVFLKTMSTSVATANPGDGVLQIGHNQTIEAVYEDISAGDGAPATVRDAALVDCQAPDISAVQVLARGRVVDVVFNTDEPACAVVTHGLSCDLLGQTITGPCGATFHSFALPTTDPSAPSYLAIEATDVAGNTAHDDNGGTCYVVPIAPSQALFMDTFAAQSIDATNWTEVFGPIVIDDAAQTEPSPPYALHFKHHDEESRVESRAVDLRSHSGLELVLWYRTNASNIYPVPVTQLALEYQADWGRWLPWSFPPAPYQGMTRFERTVLSLPREAYHAAFRFRFRQQRYGFHWWVDDVCLQQGMPSPPVAHDAYRTICGDSPTLLTLSAGDDGLPDPPGRKESVITALPVHGTLSDPQVGPIGTVPHVLANHGNQVVYTRHAGYTGEDRFSLKADDGGTPPQGGESGSAVITLDVLRGPPDPPAQPTPVDQTGKVAVTTTLSWSPAALPSSGRTIEVNISNAVEEYSGSFRIRGNMFQIAADTTLREIQMELAFVGTEEVRFVVYENDSSYGLGLSTLVGQFARTLQGQGRAFYSSGPVHVPLVKDRFYTIGVAWTAPVIKYYRVSEGYPRGSEVGTIRGGVGPDNISFPLPATLDMIVNVPCAYSGRFFFNDGRPACPVTYRVLLDTVNPPTGLICSDGTLPACDPGPLLLNQRYYWRVIAEHCCGATAGPVWQFATTLPPDHDDDGDVDQSDFGYLQRCLTGPGVATTDPSCFGALFDEDDDVDGMDLDLLRGCMSGAGVSIDPSCLN